MSKLTFGVIGTSKKEDEQRVPIHPDHLLRIPEEYRRQLIFEEGYGAPFDVSDSDLVFQTGGIASRCSSSFLEVPMTRKDNKRIA